MLRSSADPITATNQSQNAILNDTHTTVFTNDPMLGSNLENQYVNDNATSVSFLSFIFHRICHTIDQ
jgi:hypothetical protein